MSYKQSKCPILASCKIFDGMIPLYSKHNNIKIMESTTDFEKLLFLYKTEGKHMSIETFCVHNGINYKAFDRWYRNTHKDIVPVQIVEDKDLEADCHEIKEDPHSDREARISISRYLGNGIYVKRKHLTYPELKELINKLECIC